MADETAKQKAARRAKAAARSRTRANKPPKVKAAPKPPKRKPLGRPSAMTEQVVADIVEALGAGGSIKASAGRAGISETTYHRWIAEAEQPDATKPFREFRERTTRAREARRVHLAECITRAAPEDWRAAAWLLERAEPETFGAKQKLEHSGPDGAPIQSQQDAGLIDPRKLTSEQRLALIEIMDAGTG